jgi:3-hydroxyisobutyrate dehydrogenase-like beta-hydroxyacid dehydrogenase
MPTEAGVSCGFVGLGQMGGAMAVNLARSHKVVAFRRSGGGVPSLASEGLRITDHLADLAVCDIVLLCLPSDKAVEDVLFGANGLAALLQPGTIILDTGTTDYLYTLSLAERLEKSGLLFLDAPVTGMQQRARDGTLTMMCGGPADIVERVRPVVTTMCNSVIHAGPVGSGQLVKLINQLLFDINMAALAEVLPFAARLGLDPEQVSKVVNTGTGRSFASEFFLPNILEGKFDAGYPLSAAYKDLVSASALSAQQAVPLPVLAAATATYQAALQEGHGDKDKGAMILVFERLLDARFRAAPHQSSDTGIAQ